MFNLQQYLPKNYLKVQVKLRFKSQSSFLGFFEAPVRVYYSAFVLMSTLFFHLLHKTVKFMTAYCYWTTAHSATVINQTNNWDRKDKLSHLLLRVLKEGETLTNSCQRVWHWNSLLSVILQCRGLLKKDTNSQGDQCCGLFCCIGQNNFTRS